MKNDSYCSSKKYFWIVQCAAGYHPGPVAPPRTDGASLGPCACQKASSRILTDSTLQASLVPRGELGNRVKLRLSRLLLNFPTLPRSCRQFRQSRIVLVPDLEKMSGTGSSSNPDPHFWRGECLPSFSPMACHDIQRRINSLTRLLCLLLYEPFTKRI